MHKIIFYGSYLAWPFLGLMLFLLFSILPKTRKSSPQARSKRLKFLGNLSKFKKISASIIIFGFILLSVFFIYARFFERYNIIIRESDLNLGMDKKIVLIADMHLGVYKNGKYLHKVVNKINSIKNIDAVLVAGDFTYHPENIAEESAAYGKINAPVYAILGNHDLQHPGPNIRAELEKTLIKNKINIINNKAVNFGDKTQIIGLGDNWAEEDDVSFLKKVVESNNKNNIILTHNPDTTRRYGDINFKNKSITLTGHTHCGQIRIPVLYKSAIPTTGKFYHSGHYDLDNNSHLYITCGLGEVGLPMRLLNPPSIDVINL